MLETLIDGSVAQTTIISQQEEVYDISVCSKAEDRLDLSSISRHISLISYQIVPMKQVLIIKGLSDECASVLENVYEAAVICVSGPSLSRYLRYAQRMF